MQLRDLIRCARSRQTGDWDHTASVMAAIANSVRDRKSKPVSAMQFHPWRASEKRKPLSKQEAKRQLEEARRLKAGNSPE